MKKHLSTFLAALLLAALLAGCTTGGFKAMNYSENSGADYWTASYELFDGYKQRELTLSGDSAHSFEVEIQSNAGKLALSIKDSNGASLYNSSELPTSSFKVEAFGAGKYTIRFKAENHNGSYSVKWV